MSNLAWWFGILSFHYRIFIAGFGRCEKNPDHLMGIMYESIHSLMLPRWMVIAQKSLSTRISSLKLYALLDFSPILA